MKHVAFYSHQCFHSYNLTQIWSVFSKNLGAEKLEGEKLTNVPIKKVLSGCESK